MEVTIRITKILEGQKFTSKTTQKEYIKHTFVGETGGDYSKTIAFSAMDDKFSQMGLVVGADYTISFELSSREWNGKYFTEATAWRAVRADGNAPQANAPAGNSAPTQQSNDTEEMPF